MTSFGVFSKNARALPAAAKRDCLPLAAGIKGSETRWRPHPPLESRMKPAVRYVLNVRAPDPQRVLLPDVVPQLLEAALHAPVTKGAVNVEKSSHCFLQSAVLEANAILSVPWQVFQRSHSSKWLDRVAKDDLLEVFTQSRKTVNTMGKLKKNGKSNGWKTVIQ